MHRPATGVAPAERGAGAAVVLWCLALAAGVCAHDLARSESVVVVAGKSVRAVLTIDLLAVPGIDVNGDGEVSYGELDDEIDRVYAMVKDHFALRADGTLVRTALERYAVREGHVGRLDLLFEFDRAVTRLTMTSTFHRVMQPTHEHLTSVSFGGEPRHAVLDARASEAVFTPGTDGYPATLVLGLLAAAAIASAAVVQALRRSERS